MELDEFYEEETTTDIQVIENQLIIAKQMQNKLIELEKQKKAIEDTEKEMKKKLEEVMRANGITGFESNDKTLKISLGEDTTNYDIDKDMLFEKYPNIYRECNVKETKRKGTLRITIREVGNEKK